MSDQAHTPENPNRATTAEAAANAKRRAGAIGGALAGVAVVAVLVAVFVFVQVGGDDTEPAPPSAAAPSAAAPAEQPPAEQPPAAPPADLDPALRTKPQVKAGTGDVKALKVTPVVKGTGPAVKAGQQLTVNYVGVTYRDGKEFDSSWKTGEPVPVTFPIGTGNLIKGWDEGLIGVPVGSRVQLDIPADMAYGEKTTGGRPAGDLRFVVDVLQAA